MPRHAAIGGGALVKAAEEKAWMSARRYARVRYPWHAAIDLTAPGPAAFYATLLGNGLRSGRRTRYRLAPLWRMAARHPPPETLAARGVRALPREARPDIDDMLRDLVREWPKLAARSERLPSAAPPLTALALQRSAGLTVFVFGEGRSPLLVMKLATAKGQTSLGDRLATEAGALREAEPACVAPRELGTVGDAYAQEALQGLPLPLEALEPRRAASLRWTDMHEQLAAALTRLARATAKPVFPEELRRPVELALAEGGLDGQTRAALASAWDDIAGLEVSVLRHHDASAENCLFCGERLAGIIDWEHAQSRGAPGFDDLNAALAYMELSVGLSRWSQERVTATFETAWRSSDFWWRARAAAGRSAVEAGVPEDRVRSLETVFFGSRVGERLAGRVVYPTDLGTARSQLELVCAEAT